jgi:hypothetical protein
MLCFLQQQQWGYMQKPGCYAMNNKDTSQVNVTKKSASELQRHSLAKGCAVLALGAKTHTTKSSGHAEHLSC